MSYNSVGYEAHIISEKVCLVKLDSVYKFYVETTV